MNWQGVSETSKQKIDSLIASFSDFIETNHKNANPSDQRIIKEWSIFKKLIEQDPTETDSHTKHVNELRNVLLREEVSSHMKNREGGGGGGRDGKGATR
jgi:competence protein ComGF